MSSDKNVLEVDLQGEELTLPQKKYLSELRAQFSDDLDLVRDFNLLIDKWKYRSLDGPYTPLNFIRDSVPLLKHYPPWIEHLTVFIGENYSIKCYPGTRDPTQPNDWPCGHIIVTMPNGTRIYSTNYVRVPISWHYENSETVRVLEGKHPPPPGRGVLVTSGGHYAIMQTEERRAAAALRRSQDALQSSISVNSFSSSRSSTKDTAKVEHSRRSNEPSPPSPPSSNISIPERFITAPSTVRNTKKTSGQGARHDLLLARGQSNSTSTAARVRPLRKTVKETDVPKHHDKEKTSKMESNSYESRHNIVSSKRSSEQHEKDDTNKKDYVSEHDVHRMTLSECSAPKRLVDQRTLPLPIPSRYAYARNMNVADTRYPTSIFQSSTQGIPGRSPPSAESSRSVRHGQQELSRETLNQQYRREMRTEDSRYPVFSGKLPDPNRLFVAPRPASSAMIVARDVRAMGPVSRMHLDKNLAYSHREYPSSAGGFPPMSPKSNMSSRDREHSNERGYTDRQSTRRAPSSTVSQTPELEHYQAFVDSVREYFTGIDEKWIYIDFLAILRVYQNSKQGDNPMGDQLACIEDMAYLFRDYPNFIIEFARILGNHAVQCGHGWVKVTTPGGEVFKTTEDGHERPWESRYSIPPVYRPVMGSTASPRSSGCSESVETQIKVEPDSD